MPTYQFTCRMCGATDDVTCSISEYDDDNFAAPICSNEGRHPFNEMGRRYSVPKFTIDGLSSDRFKYEDKILANRQKLEERGMPES